jgi:hypothetical protein
VTLISLLITSILPPRIPRGRQAGGQPGHPRHDRPDPAPDQLDVVCEHFRDSCPTCQGALTDVRHDAGAASTQYVWELAVVRPEITAHHYHTVCCPGCGALVTAARPGAVLWRKGCFGAHSADGNRFVERTLSVCGPPVNSRNGIS